MIEVKNVTKKYGKRVALDDLSLTIEHGKIYGLLGENGAGKSTTMNIITGYLAPSMGEVYVDDYDILKDANKAKAKIGYLPELPPLYQDMTVKEYLKFVAQLKRVPRKERKEAVEEAINNAGIADVKNRLIKNLSKGYKQRVGIAQAILGSPEIVILDEPTVGLDPVQINEIRELIREIGKEHTVILSSHILSEIQEVCDHVFMISKGKLVLDEDMDKIDSLEKLFLDISQNGEVQVESKEDSSELTEESAEETTEKSTEETTEETVEEATEETLEETTEDISESDVKEKSSSKDKKLTRAEKKEEKLRLKEEKKDAKIRAKEEKASRKKLSKEEKEKLKRQERIEKRRKARAKKKNKEDK